MFASLQLTNFQSHKLSELDFSEGVNVIVGQSDTGKTAILRAMNWIINGRPRGSGFIYEGEKVCTCCLYVSTLNGLVSIKRKRKGDVTEYQLDNLKSEKPIVFTAFGSDIPEEITQVFNFNDINIQDQLSPYFLVLDTPGRVAQYLNEITKLDEIDKVVSLLSKKIRDTNAILSQTEDELKTAKQKLHISQLFDLECFDKKIISLSDLYEEIKKLTMSSMALALAIAQLEENYIKYNKLPKVTVEQAMVLEKEATICDAEKKRIVRLFSSVHELGAVIKSLSKLPEKDIIDFDMIKEQCIEYEKSAQKFNDLCNTADKLESIKCDLVELPDCDEDINSAGLLGKQYIEEKKEVSSFEHTIYMLSNINVENAYIHERLMKYSKEESDILDSLTVCPYCKQELDDEAKNILLAKER